MMLEENGYAVGHAGNGFDRRAARVSNVTASNGPLTPVRASSSLNSADSGVALKIKVTGRRPRRVAR